MRSAVVTLLFGVCFLTAALPAHAKGASAGNVKIVKASGSSSARNSGGSATVFSLALPKNATCPRDSADGNYRVQSFLVPVGTDLGAMSFKSQGPDVAGGWAVYKTTSNAYIQEMTADAPKKTDPGPIIDLPDLSFAVFTGGELAPGDYEIGVACSLWNNTVKYWSAPITVTKDDTDLPAHLHWQVIGAAAPHRKSSSKAIGAVASLALVAGLIAVGLRQRSGR